MTKPQKTFQEHTEEFPSAPHNLKKEVWLETNFLLFLSMHASQLVCPAVISYTPYLNSTSPANVGVRRNCDFRNKSMVVLELGLSSRLGLAK